MITLIQIGCVSKKKNVSESERGVEQKKIIINGHQKLYEHKK